MQPTPQHMDRRVLDPNFRAHARRMNETWIVTAGTSVLIATSRYAAETSAIIHNGRWGFEQTPTDGRTS